MAHLPSQHYRPGKTTLKLQALGVSPPVEANRQVCHCFGVLGEAVLLTLRRPNDGSGWGHCLSQSGQAVAHPGCRESLRRFEIDGGPDRVLRPTWYFWNPPWPVGGDFG